MGKKVVILGEVATWFRVIASEIGVDVFDIGDDVAFADLGVNSCLSLSIAAKSGESYRKAFLPRFPMSL